METEVEKILDVIDGIMDISNFVLYNQPMITTLNGTVMIHPYKKNDEWNEIREKIDKDLRDKDLIKDDETVRVNFDIMGKMSSIEKIVDIYEKPDTIEQKINTDEFEVCIKRTSSYVINHESVNLIISHADWINYKRTKLMDKMLNG